MRYIYARRLQNNYQCDPDIVSVPDGIGLTFGDIIMYSLPNGNRKRGYYICESEDVGISRIVSVFREVEV